MKVNDLWSRAYQPAVSAPKINKTEQEMKKAAQEFTAVFYEKMLTNMLQANTGEKMPHQDLAWQMLIGEIASEMSAASKSLAAELFAQTEKKEQNSS